MTARDVPEMWSKARPVTDPRQFIFAIVCHQCGVKKNTTSGIKEHLKRICPKRPHVDVECGHCGLRVTSWTVLAAHLNQRGMHLCEPCRPDLRVEINRPPVFSHPLPPMRASMLRTMATKARTYNALQCYPQSDMVAMAMEAARIRRADTFGGDVEISDDESEVAPSTRNPQLRVVEAALGAPLDSANSPITISPVMEQPGDVTTGEVGSEPPVLPDSPQATQDSNLSAVPEVTQVTETLTDRPTESALVLAPESGAEGGVSSDHPDAPTPQACDSTEEQTPLQIKQEVVDLTWGSSEDELASREDSASTEIHHLRKQVNSLKRRQSEYLRQLSFFAEALQKLGKKTSPPPTPTEAKQRRKFVESGLWPSSLKDVETMPYAELGQRLGDFYEGCSSQLD